MSRADPTNATRGAGALRIVSFSLWKNAEYTNLPFARDVIYAFSDLEDGVSRLQNISAEFRAD